MKLDKFVYLVALDQITKFLAFRDFFNFCPCSRPTKNYGLIFSVDFGEGYWILPILFFLWLAWYLLTAKPQLKNWYLLLLFAGAASNLLDRISLGYVRDFINLGVMTVNFADVYLLIGLIQGLWPGRKAGGRSNQAD